MHPSDLRRSGGEEPQPFRRQYGEPGLLFPVYNHLLAATEVEFRAVAYAFLQSLPRLGAGNPKGLDLFEDEAFGPYLVVDQYKAPLGRRVVLPPTVQDPEEALRLFREWAEDAPQGKDCFHRRKGREALQALRSLAEEFIKNPLA